MKLKLKVMGVLASVLLMVSGASAACTLNDITLDSTVAGSWSSDCNATSRDGSYAQYYTFTLIGSEIVQIDLKSPTDTYLYLLSDANISGTVINFDDDGGEGGNSKIISELPAGTYTIEATTYGASQLGDFNLTLSKSALMNYSFPGTVNLPAEILALLDNCVDLGCPSVYIDGDVNLSDGNAQNVSAQVDYNDTTSKYEYQFNVFAEANNTSMDIIIVVNAVWNDEATGELNSHYVSYSFGADQAVGGEGSDADYPVENCDPAIALHVELNTSLPIIEIDLSNYTLPVFSQATMVLNNVPSNIDISLGAYSPSVCLNADSFVAFNQDGSRTLTVHNLLDGHEYGFGLFSYSYTASSYKEYFLNDDDGDFTNGGVFVEDPIYDELDIPVFNKTILVTPEDVIISAPENLKFGNPALIPTIYLLLM